MACKPDSVEPRPVTIIHLGVPLLTRSSSQPGSAWGGGPRAKARAIPIWPCSRRGLPCQFCCQNRGGLLLHRFTLTPTFRLHEVLERSVLCGAFPRVAPAGRYPAPFLHGVRTFLPQKGDRPTIRTPQLGRSRANVKARVISCNRSRHRPVCIIKRAIGIRSVT